MVIVDGGPWTGKSVLAINLLCSLVKDKCKIRYANAAPRAVRARLTTSQEISNFNLVYRKWFVCIHKPNEYDMLIVDEAHRLGLKSVCIETWVKTKKGSSMGVSFQSSSLMNYKKYTSMMLAQPMIRTMAEVGASTK